MPEIKNTFLGGKMNKDLDERLIPKNEYRDALNVEVSTSQGDDVGSLQNTFGNTAQSDLSSVITGGKCIGSIVDKKNDKIYWFIKGSNTDAIAEYDAKLRSITPVLVDSGMATTYTQSFDSLNLNPGAIYTTLSVVDSSANYWTNGSAAVDGNGDPIEGSCWDISNGVATQVWGRVGYMNLFKDEVNFIEGNKYEIEYDINILNEYVSNGNVVLINQRKNSLNVKLDTSSSGTKKTQWIQGHQNTNRLAVYSWAPSELQNVLSIDNIKVREVNRFLNFSSVSNITGINIIDGMLFWTDGENEPKKINIERCKAGSYGVSNFNATSYVGPELLTNGNFSLDSSWSFNVTKWGISNNVMNTIADIPPDYSIRQNNVAIKRGKTYLISVDIGGTFTTGSLTPVIVDEFGGWTKPAHAQYATSTGSYTWTLTSGVTDANSLSDKDAGYDVGFIRLLNDSLGNIDSGLTVDNFSIREVAFDWTRTTKVKDASGAYSRNIKEEDITLIKKYPLNAPNMELIGTTKPTGSVINTSCETPMYTTFEYGYFYEEGSGDEIRYKDFQHMYLRQDAQLLGNLIDENSHGNIPMLQINIGPDWEAIGPSDSGTAVDYPLYTDETNPNGIGLANGAPINVANSFTGSPEYYKKAWQTWMSIGHLDRKHIYCIDENGAYDGVSSGIHSIDKISGRAFITPSKGSSLNDTTLWKKGQRVVLGHWNFNNNHSFWTYKDGDGNILVKPPGTTVTRSENADGTMLRDEYGGGGDSTPTIYDPTDKYTDSIEDFGGGWSVVDGKYVGSAHATTADVPHNSHARDLDSYSASNAWSFQTLHDVITGLKPGRSYILNFKINVTADPSPNGAVAVGILNRDATTNIEIHSSSLSGGLSKNGLSGEYTFQSIFTVKPLAPLNTNLTFFKRDGVECTISAITIDDKRSNAVKIQSLVFSPKPNYEVGDLVKMTNSNKAPNGDDIEVKVRLIKELENGGNEWKRKGKDNFHNQYLSTDEHLNDTKTNFKIPESWYDDVTVSTIDLIDDSDFDLSGATENPYEDLNTFASGGDLNTTTTNSADWTTSLAMIKGGYFDSQNEFDTYWEQDASAALGSGTGFGWITGGDAGIDDAVAGNWPSLRQRADIHNPRIFWEEGGVYNTSFNVQAITTTVDASNNPDGGFYMTLENSLYYETTTVASTTGTKTQAITYDKAVWSANTYDNKDRPALRLSAIRDATRNTTGHIDHIKITANANINRISWGSGNLNKCTVVTGTTSQIISYPSNPSGAKIDVDGVNNIANFSLTGGEYYKIEITVSGSNYTSAANSMCNIRLFDCDFWAQHGNLQGGDIYLDASNGLHSLIWKQKEDATQLHIAFGPGFAGDLDLVEVFAVTVNNTLDLGADGSNADRKVFDVEIVSIDKSLTQLPVAQHKYWSCSLEDEEPLFKKVFPRFAYRWKYQDGEYSAISAFTEVAFLPDDTYRYDAQDGYNLAMENTTRRVVLDSFDKMPNGVTEIDILYKESNSNNIYTFKTVKGAELQGFTELVITKEKFHSLIDSKQILRPYDNVPRKARAQEMSANRIIFGNYTQQYDISTTDEPIVNASLSSSSVLASNEAKRSVKSIREYQVGVSYLDAYGRQSPVFSNDNALIKVNQTSASSSNSILASLENHPPEWVTHYKYYVKDSASSYYNISLDRFYQAEEGNHVWLSFPSSEFNKIREDDYLVLKKQHNSDSAILNDVETKYKVLSVKGNAPEFIKMTRKNVGGKVFNTDGKGLEFHSLSSYGGSAAGWPQVDKLTFRIKGSIVSGNQALEEAFMDNQAGRYIRIGRSIRRNSSLLSNYYEILHISRVSANDADWDDEEDYYEVTLVRPLANDAAFVGSEHSTSVKLFLEYFREELNEFDNNFEGKFFVKIAKDNSFDRFIGSKQKVEDTGFNITNAQDTHWAFHYEDTANSSADKGQDTDTWLKVRSLTATSTAEINSIADGNFDWTISSSEPLAATTPSVYNATAVTNFPALHDPSVEIDGTDVANPFTVNWLGTTEATDWGHKAATADEVPQRFFIDQTHAFGWGRGDKSYTGENTLRSNSTVGNGFVMGNNYCSFTFVGLGDVEFGADGTAGGGTATSTEPDPSTSDVDTNTWADGGDGELSAQWFNNFKLLQQLTTVGTQFRWHDDPTDTIYTVETIVQSKKKYNHHRKLPNGEDYGTSAGGLELSKKPENFGWRIDLMLDKPIKWSPTATISAGTGLNANNTHTALLPLQFGVSGSIDSTSQIQVLERRPNEVTYTSFNPAVFEIEPKERADLNLYYETPKAAMVLKEGMYIEALNNSVVNDGSGLPGSIYKPGGTAALPYTKILGSEIVANPNFEVGISNWAGNGATGFVLTYQALTNRFKLTSTTSSGQYPNVNTTPSITLVDGQRYQVVVDVHSMDNDAGQFGGTPIDTKIYFITTDEAYRPFGNVGLTVGINVIEFVYDATLATSPTDAGSLQVELTNNDDIEYSKEIILNSISMTTLLVDETKPAISILAGDKYYWDDASSFYIPGASWSDTIVYPEYYLGADLPAGITVRISEIDEAESVAYFKEYKLSQEVLCNGSTQYVTLPPQTLAWHNCFSFGNGVESNRLRDDYNAVTIDKGPRVSTTLEETYKEEKKGSGMIFSGIYNSTSSVNQLNQFIQAESITKDLNPEYGTIQKLFTRNTNIVALCENKILKVLANKDALYNADGSMQVTASNSVLGQAIPFVGEYGISRNPESFANFGYRVYFTDKDRGAVLRLSADGLTPISDKDMISYFKANLPNSSTIVGSYDENRDAYNISLPNTTVSFSEKVNGWTSFKSFVAQSGVSLNGEYYTFKDSDIWKHHSKALRNSFYNNQYESTVKFIFNDIVDEIKNFKTLNYEGTVSREYKSDDGQEDQLLRGGWYSGGIKTDLESAEIVSFVDKEGKWFNNITGITKDEISIDTKDFTSQGLGTVSQLYTTHPNYKTLQITATRIISDIGNDENEYIVNTSPTDKTQQVVQLNQNFEVGSNPGTVTKNFYIHANTVNGIKYAVSAGKFSAESLNSALSITISNLGVSTSGAGYHNNVIQVQVVIDYTTGNVFPSTNVESQVNIQGSPTLAIDN